MAKKKRAKKVSKKATRGAVRRGRPPGSKNKVAKKTSKKTSKRRETKRGAADMLIAAVNRTPICSIHIDGDSGSSIDVCVAANGIDRLTGPQILRQAASEMFAAAVYLEREGTKTIADERVEEVQDEPIPYVPVTMPPPAPTVVELVEEVSDESEVEDTREDAEQAENLPIEDAAHLAPDGEDDFADLNSR